MFDGPVFGVLIGVVTLVLVLGLRYFKRAAGRAGSKAGKQIGQSVTARKLPEALLKFGETIVIETQYDAAHELIAAAVARKPRAASVLSKGHFSLKSVEPNDVTLALIDNGTFAQLQVTEFRDYFGFPQGAPFVSAFLQRVRDEAASRNVSLRSGALIEFKRSRIIDDKNFYWEQS